MLRVSLRVLQRDRVSGRSAMLRRHPEWQVRGGQETRERVAFLQGSPGNPLQRFEILVGGLGGTQFLDGAGDCRYIGNGLVPDQFSFVPGGGNDVISGFVSGQDIIELTGFAALYNGNADAFLAARLTAIPAGGYRLETGLPGSGPGQVLFTDGDRPMAADIRLV